MIVTPTSRELINPVAHFYGFGGVKETATYMQTSPATWPPPSAGMPPISLPRNAALKKDNLLFCALLSCVPLFATGLAILFLGNTFPIK